jgi:hypothetical protein
VLGYPLFRLPVGTQTETCPGHWPNSGWVVNPGPYMGFRRISRPASANQVIALPYLLGKAGPNYTLGQAWFTLS